jgi:phage tail sheath protein FI
MAVQVSYPGVYIEEFAPGAPIQGVGTSTPAFLGPSKTGPLNEPTKITNWDQFVAKFGDSPLDGFYLWYAVRGFYENGGSVCYVARVSNAAHSELVLNDMNGQPTIRLWARQPGILNPNVTVVVDDDVHTVAVANAALYRPTANVTNATGTTITTNNADDAATFRPGDVVLIDDGGGTSEEAAVLRTEGAVIRLTAALANVYAASTLRLADTAVGATEVRVENAAELGAGFVIELSQNPGGGNPVVTETAVVKSVLTEKISPALTTYRATLDQGLANSYDLTAAANPTTVQSFEFSVTLTRNGSNVPYNGLGMHPEHPRYYRRIINQDETGWVYAAPVEPPNIAVPPTNRPQTIAATPLAGGTDDNPATLTGTDYKNALALLEQIDDVNMVAIPDRQDADVQLAMIAHCENMFDRFAILDSRRGAPLFGTDSVELHRGGVESANGFAALYYPWLTISPVSGTDPILVPPSGHIAGIYARTDNNRGVHKAPAGSEALINGALGVERMMSDVDQGQLNLQGINVNRVFRPGGRPVVWGARTTSSNTNWQYVNIRRLFLFLEESIQEGIEWAVFEPNNKTLWKKLHRTLTDFLTRVWRDGALFGAAPEEAFYVRIDDALNPFSEQQLGRLHIEIGVRPSYPAEFIIVRIGIWDGGSEVSES